MKFPLFEVQKSAGQNMCDTIKAWCMVHGDPTITGSFYWWDDHRLLTGSSYFEAFIKLMAKDTSIYQSG